MLILNATNTYTTRFLQDEENGESKVELAAPYDESGKKVVNLLVSSRQIQKPRSFTIQIQ